MIRTNHIVILILCTFTLLACSQAALHPPELSSALQQPALEEPVDAASRENSSSPEASNNTYHIPMVLNHSVEVHIEYFETRGKKHFQRRLDRSGRYIPVMKDILRQNNLPEDLAYIVMIESGFSMSAVSWAKAVGPWQFMTNTAKMYDLRIDWWVDERRDPIKSTHAAAKHLRRLHDQFGSWPLALASYNAGCGRVRRAVRRTQAEDFWDLKATRHISSETKNYVPKYMAATIIAKKPEIYGFSINDAEPFDYDNVAIKRSTKLHRVARFAGTSSEEIKRLNPELKQGVTPPKTPDYILRIPKGTKDTFLANAAEAERKLKKQRLLARRNTSTVARSDSRSGSSGSVSAFSVVKDKLIASGRRFMGLLK